MKKTQRKRRAAKKPLELIESAAFVPPTNITTLAGLATHIPERDKIYDTEVSEILRVTQAVPDVPPVAPLTTAPVEASDDRTSDGRLPGETTCQAAERLAKVKRTEKLLEEGKKQAQETEQQRLLDIERDRLLNDFLRELAPDANLASEHRSHRDLIYLCGFTFKATVWPRSDVHKVCLTADNNRWLGIDYDITWPDVDDLTSLGTVVHDMTARLEELQCDFPDTILGRLKARWATRWHSTYKWVYRNRQ